MSTKELFVLKFWHKALIEIYKKEGVVTAGRLARYVGQSRGTAKKYLDQLVGQKVVWFEDVPWKNGVMSRNYGPVKGEK